jgi:eukaryotic-like serine/threonine-protein kinase
MRPERWQQIEEIFNSALELEPGQRDAYILKACGGDAGLRSQIEQLLLRQKDAEPFLEGREAGSADGSPSRPGNGTDLTNQTVLHYQIAEKIGEGGMGAVYRAKDLRLGRVVALKFLHSYLSSDYQAPERLQREARAASALDHPHVCKVYDIAEHEHRTFLVLEHLAGETLAERLKKGPLPLEQALEIGVQVADAMAAAHKLGITHRDLKPGNVMLTKSGAKLLDFGLAKVKRDVAGPVLSKEASACDPISLTVDGALLGTVPYMAPEQLEGRPADPRSDIWALAVMLYEMLAGKRPFDGTSQASLIAAILEHDPVPLTTLQPLAPPLIDHVLTCCLAKNPDARWQSAHDLAQQLRFIESGGLGSQAGETRQRTGTRRWTTIAALTAAAFALLAAGLLDVSARTRLEPLHASHDYPPR